MRCVRTGALSVALVLIGTASAHATFPGRDGRLSYARFDEAAGTFSLFSARTSGADEHKLTAFAAGVSSVFTDWSPDGRWIAFDSDQGKDTPIVYVMRGDGSHLRKLTNTPSLDPAWSPSGRRLAVEADWGTPTLEGIWTIPFRKDRVVGKADARRVTKTPATMFDSEPQYSPNGRWIAFTRFRSAEQSAIYKIRTNGTGLRRLTDFADNASAPDWSPDGKRISYDTHDAAPAPNAGNIMTMRPDGSHKRKLIAGTATAYNQNPVFSPSGHFIAYVVFPATGSGAPFIWIARTDGSHRRRLAVANDTNKPDWGSRPHRVRQEHRRK